jgi:Bacterial Ig domain
MMRVLWRVLLCVLAMQAASVSAVSPDHHEFEAALNAPFRGDAGEAREFRLFFSYIDAVDPSTVAWRVELLSQDGKQLHREWLGEERLFRQPIEVAVPWNGRDSNQKSVARGFYLVRMTAVSGDPIAMRALSGTVDQRVATALASAPQAKVQEWEIHIGTPPKISMPAFAPLPVGAAQAKSLPSPGGLPYVIYLGNLHTQSNDSDGGGNVATCSGSQGAQTGQFGPGDGFDYARNHGLDFSVASEHNHYFDGSSGTNGSAVPAVAIARYQAGLNAAITSNTNNPGFLAIYGMEWGVIANGGHMNIFNSNELFAWETNSMGQLIGDVLTPKSNYPAIYATMRARNLVGQFNHPDDGDGQFVVDGTVFGYHADGDEVMVLAEIQNTSAFSNNTTETETGRSSYETDVRHLLEAGFHVAPATNQDNHCANWGASWTNRTAVLISNALPLNRANFLDALRARRVFATSDKQSQLIFTGNGHLMGERFDNVGALNLTAGFFNNAGRTVSQVQILEGVPGRNGTVTVLVSTPTHSFTPSTGPHFYYVRLVQDDGKILWSAPLWVNQLSGTDTTAPSVTASVQGARLDIDVLANATDNVGITEVAFYIDNVLRGQDTSAPYALEIDSTALSDGPHTLVAHAFDAALNEGISTPLQFSIDNTAPSVTASVQGSSGMIDLQANASDNTGVANVVFYVDNVLRGQDGSAPYVLPLDSTSLSNGTHSLVAHALDAALNEGVSTSVQFSIDNTALPDAVFANGFEL